MSEQLQKLVEDVAVLKEQNATSADIHDRLDSAIDKLTDIQSGIKSMLAVHEERIVRAEESDVEIQSIMENRQETIREDIQTLHKRITDETKDLEPLLKAEKQINFFLKKYPNSDY